MTWIVRVDPKNPDVKVLVRVAEIIKRGGLVAFPTETVYGLGTNALDEKAVRKLFEVKGRESKPISVIVPDFKTVEKIAKPNEKAKALIERFFPGPITVVMEKKPIVPDVVTAGLNKVGIRMPNHPIALKIAELCGVPIATPSANISGKPSPTKAQHVIEDFMGKIDAIVDGGETGFGIESTVVDTTTEPARVLRIGAVSIEDIEDVVGRVVVRDYRSYKPKCRVVVVFGDRRAVMSKIKEMVEDLKSRGFKVCVVVKRNGFECDCFEIGEGKNVLKN